MASGVVIPVLARPRRSDRGDPILAGSDESDERVARSRPAPDRTGQVVDRDPFGRPGPRRRPRAGQLLAVFVGGAAGGLVRYEIGEVVPETATGFPMTTFAINVAGSFALALLLVLLLEVAPPTTYARSAVGTGFLGAFTTFSAVVTAVDRFISGERVATAVGYLAASVVGALAAASFGLVLGRSIGAARRRRSTDRSA